jgi:hypothetical protein
MTFSDTRNDILSLGDPSILIDEQYGRSVTVAENSLSVWKFSSQPPHILNLGIHEPVGI